MSIAINRPAYWAADELVNRDDRELVAECLRGKSAAWEALINRYRRLIYSIPIKAKLSADYAADIFQSTCLKLFENLPNLRHHEKIGPWLITTASRECWRVASQKRRDRLRTCDDEKCGTSGLGEIQDHKPLPDEELEIIERQQMVCEAIDALPERNKKLKILLFYQKDVLSYAEIARRMNRPVSSIGPTRARCLQKLRMIMGDYSRRVYEHPPHDSKTVD